MGMELLGFFWKRHKNSPRLVSWSSSLHLFTEFVFQVWKNQPPRQEPISRDRLLPWSIFSGYRFFTRKRVELPTSSGPQRILHKLTDPMSFLLISWMLLVKDGLITLTPFLQQKICRQSYQKVQNWKNLTPFLQQKNPYKKSARIRNPGRWAPRPVWPLWPQRCGVICLLGLYIIYGCFRKLWVPPNHPF